MKEQEGFEEIGQRMAELESNEKVKKTKAELCQGEGADGNF